MSEQGSRKQHACDEVGDCAPTCQACEENVAAGLNPDGSEPVCHCGEAPNGPSHTITGYTHDFVEYGDSEETERRRIARAVAAEREACAALLDAAADGIGRVITGIQKPCNEHADLAGVNAYVDALRDKQELLYFSATQIRARGQDSRDSNSKDGAR